MYKCIKAGRVCAFFLIALIVSSCSGISSSELVAVDSIGEANAAPQYSAKIAEQTDIDDMPLTDYDRSYIEDGYDDELDIVYFYVTVTRGSKGSDTDNSFEDVNAYRKALVVSEQVPAPMAEALIQEGNEYGPAPGMFGYSTIVPNATINVRGYTSTRIHTEKSFSFKLKDPAGRWRQQSHIALVKSVWDPIRCRTRLGYDLLRDIPDMVSTRTQFVRLFIKDETAGSDEFVDFGFYTQVEIINKRYLKNHALDSTGQLYKAVMFEFYRYPEYIRTKDDPLYNTARFEYVLEIKGNDDHRKLISMLEDVNNYALDINDVVDKHFNIDNYVTWLAFNILIGNVDTTAQNLFLYSPTNSNTWYFLPWDLDGAFDTVYKGMEFRQGKFVQGITNYWGVVLHRRFLTYPENRALLEAKMDELIELCLNEETVAAKIKSYTPIITDEFKKMPDFLHLGVTLEKHLEMLEETPKEIALCYNAYYESLNWPMPFFLWEVENEPDGSHMTLHWEPSYSLNGEKLTYNIVIARTPDLEDYVEREYDLAESRHSFSNLKPGLYYYYVEAQNESGNTMPAFDFLTMDDRHFYGTRRFLVKEDSTVISDYQFGEAEMLLYK